MKKRCYVTARVEQKGDVVFCDYDGFHAVWFCENFEQDLMLREYGEQISDRSGCEAAVVARDEMWQWEKDDNGDGPEWWWVGTLHAEFELYEPCKTPTRISVEFQRVMRKGER